MESPTDPTAHLFADDDLGPHLDVYARLIKEEIDSLLDVLPHALGRQWEASVAPRPREDTHQRTTGDRPNDPTADTACDPRRLAVRENIAASTKAVRDAAIALRAARRSMERTIAWYDGKAS